MLVSFERNQKRYLIDLKVCVCMHVYVCMCMYMCVCVGNGQGSPEGKKVVIPSYQLS